MALWQVRLSRTSEPKETEFDHYCEDLAEHYSIIKIGYNLSQDVRNFFEEKNYADLIKKEKYVAPIREQLKKDHPNSIKNPTKKEEEKYNRSIGRRLSAVKNFMKIKKGDYIISPYYISPNGGKISIGRVTGELEILGNLMGSKLNSFAKNYGNEKYILEATKNLALKVEWETELFEKYLLLDNKIKKKIDLRQTVIFLNFSGNLPCDLAPKSFFNNGVCP